MENSKRDWTLSGTATSLQFFPYNPFPSAKSFQFMNFSEAKFYENYLTSDFHTNTVISRLFAYSSKWRDKAYVTAGLCVSQLGSLRRHLVSGMRIGGL